MIHEVQGDILMTDAQAIAHGVSPNDHFDAGLALALREMWPSLAKDFRHYADQHIPTGEAWTFDAEACTTDNLMTQEGEHASQSSGRASIANVNHVLKRLRHEVEKSGVRSLAMPRLATGAGGLDWNDVHPLIERHLGALPLPVFVYTTYQKGQKAVEPGASPARRSAPRPSPDSAGTESGGQVAAGITFDA
ncbi:MAG: macro domain-containing protein [Gemmatimonadaceae bacterium]|nr:macro domain-containing protein [Gemmatimonadaceae bacterium]